jgi:hypothetical protein
MPNCGEGGGEVVKQSRDGFITERNDCRHQTFLGLQRQRRFELEHPSFESEEQVDQVMDEGFS